MIVLTSAEQASLRRLLQDGAWSDAEAAHLPALAQLIDEGLITRVHTVIGWLTLLTPKGLTLLGIPRRQWHRCGMPGHAHFGAASTNG